MVGEPFGKVNFLRQMIHQTVPMFARFTLGLKQLKMFCQPDIVCFCLVGFALFHVIEVGANDDQLDI